MKLKDNFMVQPIIGDDEHEYTCSVFGLDNGKTTAPIILKRKLNGEGSTNKAVVVNHSKIEAAIDTLSKELKPIGPTNFQFRLHYDQPKLLEINPRISSSTSLRTLCGYNEAEMCILFYLLGESITFDGKELPIGKKMVRFIEDMRI